jgi:hypothetical protein
MPRKSNFSSDRPTRIFQVLQLTANIFTVVGVFIAISQTSGTNSIVNAIYQSQEKNSSYRLLAVKTEIESNLKIIDLGIQGKKQYETGTKIPELSLSTTAYFASPTIFKLDHLNEADNQKINLEIAQIYPLWQMANSLIQTNMQILLSNNNLDPGLKQHYLVSNNDNILKIFEKTRDMAADIDQKISGEAI